MKRALALISPAALLVGVQTPDEMDELLGDELLVHDELQLVEVGPLLLRQQRHRLQISTTGESYTSQRTTTATRGSQRRRRPSPSKRVTEATQSGTAETLCRNCCD